MRTGVFDRTYNKDKSYWVVRGFSERSQTYVYPHHGWSWTSWVEDIRETYETLDRAKGAIASGYIKDMIKTQKVVDIVFIHVERTRKIIEHEVITAYGADGKPSTLAEPEIVTENWDLQIDNYLGVSLADDTRNPPALYCRATSIRNGKAYLRVINGAWTLVVRLGADGVLTVDEETQGGEVGTPVVVHFVGVPDPHVSASDYDHQIEFYREKQGISA
ncbi:hypothetical protein CcrJ4_gp440 [Caulobacter phage J4]|nr:hypothetical protein CcrJ4_gp440 [Caulobacter phage J4]